MKICLFAPGNSYHTKKWFDYFVLSGHEVRVVSFTKGMIEEQYLHFIDTGVGAGDSEKSKIKYLLYARQVKQIIDSIHPDVISVHRASSYGAVAALAGLKSYTLSVWGEDIYAFPRKSIVHKMLLKFSLSRATQLFSTSRAMAQEAQKYTDRQFEITPFGVDMALFSPEKRTRTMNDGKFIVGTVKALSPRYGIDNLLKAVAIVRKAHPEIPLSLRIAGRGSHEEIYKKLAIELGIDDITNWLGFIPQEEAAKEWANMDIAVIPSESESESFGVAAVEAEACAVPVIITAIPGLMEATHPGETSLVVDRGQPEQIAQNIVWLFEHPNKRISIGKLGRKFVSETYEINFCFARIIELLLRK